MVVFESNLYTEAIGGNKGVTVLEFEIEDSDRDSITEQVREILEDYDIDDYPDTLWVTLYSDTYDETIEFEVNVPDYI